VKYSGHYVVEWTDTVIWKNIYFYPGLVANTFSGLRDANRHLRRPDMFYTDSVHF